MQGNVSWMLSPPKIVNDGWYIWNRLLLVDGGFRVYNCSFFNFNNSMLCHPVDVVNHCGKNSNANYDNYKKNNKNA